MRLAGLLTYPYFSNLPSLLQPVAHYEKSLFSKNNYALSIINYALKEGIYSSGSVPDFHRIPY